MQSELSAIEGMFMKGICKLGIDGRCQDLLVETFKYKNILNVINIMVSITLAVPAELKTEMDQHQEMNWSEAARQAIKEKLMLVMSW